jgi:hypothetical protein
MKLQELSQTREEYFKTQIERSRSKFKYCKVSIKDTLNYINLIRGFNRYHQIKIRGTPLICLGTRNGREVDLFRNSLFIPAISQLIKLTEKTKYNGFHSRFDFLNSIRRSNIESINNRSVLGVEINPQGKRKDIWIGSFDELPKEWEGKFSVIYSNSFDHSQNPERTSNEWKRIAKKNAILIITFAYGLKPTISDPVGDISLEDIVSFFPGDLLYFKHMGSYNGYSEVIIRLKK